MGNLFDEEYNNAFEAFETSLMGVTFDGRQVICKQLYEGAILDLIREPNNSYDPNAIGVYYNNQSCGYIDKNHATRLAPLIDQGNCFVAFVTQTTGGGNYSYGARIRITEERKLVGPEGKDEVSFSSNWDDWLDDDQKELQDSSDTESEYDVQAVFTPTDEQRTILKYEVQDNSVINIIAFAGTGKTTTLLEYAKKRPETSFLYIAFNDSVRQEGIIRFPNNVVCHTSHSLAWSVMKKYYGHKIIVGNLRPIEIKEILNIRQIDEAIIVSNIIQRFLISTDSTFKNTHLPANIEDDKNKKRHYLEMAIKLWVYMINQDFNGKMTFDCYLKLYQLSKPKIEYDYILLDEAQDTNPVVADIILSQTCRKIFVGDPHQQIYAFRGARDAMEKIIAAKSFYLTHSFRFGKEIAWVANKILSTFKGERNNLEGFRSNNEPDESLEYAIISRTNAGLFDEAVTLYENYEISFLGNIDGYKFDELLDVYNLSKNRHHEIKSNFYKKFMSYHFFKEYAEKTDDWELKSKIKVIEKYYDLIPSLVDKIKSANVEREKADVVLSTAHKSKGSQFSYIELTSDFPDLFQDGKLNSLNPDEYNLIYVAITRAKININFSNFSMWENFFKYNTESDISHIIDYFRSCPNIFNYKSNCCDKAKINHNTKSGLISDSNSNRKIYSIRSYPINYSDPVEHSNYLYPHKYPYNFENITSNYKDIFFWSIFYNKSIQWRTIQSISSSYEFIKQIINDFNEIKGTILDSNTGLMWAYQLLDESFINFMQMKLNNKQLTTEIVIKALNNYKHAGYNDWRLPTVPELLTLYGSVVFKGCNRSPFHKLMESDVWVSDYSEYGHHDYSFYDDELDRFESGRYFINFSKNGFIHNSIELNMRKSFILPVRSYIPLEITPNVINLPRIVIPEIGYEMVYISPGTYVTKRGGTENKDVTITITKGFFIGTHPVTVRQWKSICDYLPTEYICGYKPDEYKNIYDPEQHRYYEFLTDDSPIICSCYEAHTFLDNLKKALEKEYAIGPFLLPTEAEWEFACRAGSDTNYCYGDNDDYLPYYGWNYMDDLSCNEAIIHPVGALLPNNWGLYDMHGNIPEFTRDIVLHSEVCQRSDNNILIDPQYPPRNHIIDSSDNTGDGYEYHVIAKGGGWSDPPAKCRSYEYDLLGVYSWSAESIAFRFIIYGTPEQFFHYSKKGYESAT